jgi:hypothetical protein
MAVYLVIGSRNLRTRVTAACGSFYMPCARCALVLFDGTAEQLARRLILLSNEDPPHRSGDRVRSPQHGWVTRLFSS